MKLFSIISLLFFIYLESFGQHKGYKFEFEQSPLCIENGDTLSLAWAGGLNAPQFNSMDVNKDGITDLALFDQSFGKMVIFISDGQSYTYGFDYSEAFPGGGQLYGWVLLRDANCDGNKDIYTKSSNGAQIFRYLDGPVNYPLWTSFDPLIHYDTVFNIPISEADIPVFEDIDMDGDIDLATFEFTGGGTVGFYRNLSIELVGNCSISEFARITNCWGRMYECQICGQYDVNLGANCLIGDTSQNYCAPRVAQHAGSTMLSLDMDGDSDLDLLLGDIGCSEVSYLENIGDNTFTLFDSARLGFPFNTTPVSFFEFPAMFYEDVDFDSVRDFLVTPNTTVNPATAIDMSKSVHFYKNTGTDDSPIFSYTQNDLLQEDMLDVGERSYPALIDYDGDGDLDLFIGNRGTRINGITKAVVRYYENTGDVNLPEFTLADPDFLSLSTRNLEDIRPFFHDLTGDGIKDMAFTWYENDRLDYRFNFVKNEGSIGSQMMYNPDSIGLYPIGSLNLFLGDVPTFYDVNSDGVDDLILGISNFNYLKYYRNDGTISNPVFVEENGNVGFLANIQLGNAEPSLILDDFDGNGDIDLLWGDQIGRLKMYGDFINNINTSDTLRPTTNLIVNDILSPGIPISRKINEFLKITSGDLNNDNKADIVMGTKSGGIHIFYNRSTPVNGLSDFSRDSKRLKVFPVPSDQAVTIELNESGILEVQDILGRLIQEVKIDQPNSEYVLDISNFESGIYLLRFKTDKGELISAKMIRD